jgi:hypothetical protein
MPIDLVDAGQLRHVAFPALISSSKEHTSLNPKPSGEQFGVRRSTGAYFGSVKQVGSPTFSLRSLISAFAYAARRSEGSERARAPNAKSRGIFLSEFILAYTAPGERFNFFAIRPTLILEAMSLRNWASSAGVQGVPLGVGLSSRETPHLKGLSNRNKHAVARWVSKDAQILVTQLMFFGI